MLQNRLRFVENQARLRVGVQCLQIEPTLHQEAGVRQNAEAPPQLHLSSPLGVRLKP